MQIIKIALVDDHKVFCQCLERMLNSVEEMKVVTVSHSGKQFIEELEKIESFPDIVLLDIDMPEMNGLQTLQILKEKYPYIKVIMLSLHEEASYILRTIESGAEGYLKKDARFEEVEQSIRNVNTYGRYYNDTVNTLIQERIKSRNKSKLKLDFEEKYLTNREIQIIELICQQKTNTEIANILEIGLRTVESLRASLMKKVKVDNSVGLVLYAISKKIYAI